MIHKRGAKWGMRERLVDRVGGDFGSVVPGVGEIWRVAEEAGAAASGVVP